MDKKKILDELKNILLWAVGCSSYSIGVNCFVKANGIAQSGMTGLALMLNKLFDVPLGITGFILNIPLLILMWIFLGKKLVAKTLVVSAILSVALDGLATFLPTYTGDKLLATLFCGLFEGFGLGLIMATGATSGGTDIVGKLFHKAFPHISVGKIVMVADALIILSNMLVFKSIESGLYAIIIIFVSTKVIDTIIYGVGSGKMLMIITEKSDEISKAIISAFPRGVTIVPATGAYSGKSKNMLVCVARKHEIADIIKLSNSIDSHTFTIVSEANEIIGKGFSSGL